MKKSLIWESVLGLSERDRTSFLQFIKSPYFNNRPELIKITEFLFQQEFLEGKDFTRKDIFTYVYSDSLKFDDQKIRLYLSYLQKKIGFFLTIEELKESDSESSWLMISAMQKRNLPRISKKKLKFFTNSVSKRSDWTYHFGQYRLELEKLKFVSDTSKEKVDYEHLAGTLDKFYLSAKLRHICSAILYHSVFDKDYEFPKIDLVMELANQEAFLKIPTISIYYYFIKVVTGEDFYFSKIKDILFSHQEDFSEKEFKDAYKNILNFYIRMVNEKSHTYVAEALDFYKKGLELDLLIENGFLSRIAFSNIVGMAVFEKDIEWADHFVESYKPFLRKAVRQEVYSLNKARVEYLRKNFDAALNHIVNVNYKEVFPAVTARILQIKIYWESDELELLENHLRSLNFFLKRRKVKGYHYEVFTNIIKYTRKMSEVNGFDSVAVKKLRESIEKEEKLREKEWLLEQLDAL